MHFQDILHWALNTVKDQAQKAAIAEVQKLTLQLNDTIQKHAPDMQQMVQEQLAKAATSAVAGILSKKV